MAEVVFQSRLAKVSRKETKIYRLKSPAVDERSLLRTAKQFGLQGSKRKGRIVASPESMSYSEGPYQLDVVKASGAFRIRDVERWQVDDGRTNIRMSDKAAVAAAKKTVQKYGLASLRECQVLNVSRLRVGTLQRGENRTKERVIDVAVVFQRLIDGVPVEGPGGKLGVFLDGKGRMTGCEMLWRPLGKTLRAVPSRELLDPADAEEKTSRVLRKMGAARVEVEEMKFAYYEAGICEAQRTLQPAYVMPMRMHSSQEEMVMKSLHVVAAAKKPAGRILPRKKRRPKQPKRRK